MTEPDSSQDSSRGLGRRTLVMLMVVATIGAPAAILRVACVGRSCDQLEAAQRKVPFCSLEEAFRVRIANGFREERSPDIFAVPGDTAVVGSSLDPEAAWPSAEDGRIGAPLVLWGEGIKRGELPSGARFDSVAPTLAVAAGLDRPHPEVRSGRALDVATPGKPRLIVLIALRGIGPDDVTTMPTLARLIAEGAGTDTADPGSLPLDPAALTTTLGTGALPRRHGITGSLLRTDLGKLVEAWSPSAPGSVIATLADDLDESTSDRSKIGMVAATRQDRGLIGAGWYLDADRDDFVLDSRKPVRSVRRLLNGGYGQDEVTDLLAVSLQGSPQAVDPQLAAVIASTERVAGGKITLMVAGTGRRGPGGGPTARSQRVAHDLEQRLGGEVVEGVAPGGFFIDQGELTRLEITEERVTAALSAARTAGGARLFADTFPAIAVSFARYCS